MNISDKIKNAALATELLEKAYPDALCSLESASAFELLIATRLSAQCTDARVNLITPVLFEQYKTIDEMAEAETADVEKIIFSCGFYRQKAKDIVGIAVMLREKYNYTVPDTIEELTKLPGVGRKTANLIVGDIYKKPAVVADTHLIRITNLLGFVATKDPLKVELELKKILPAEKSNDFCHRCVLHGREVCVARRPGCDKCVLNPICEYFRH